MGMFNDLITSGAGLKQKLRNLRSLPAETNLRKQPLAKQYLIRRITFEVERNLHQQAGTYVPVQVEAQKLGKAGYSAVMRAAFEGASYQIKARLFCLDELWLCFIVFQPSFGEVVLLMGHGPSLGDALFTNPTEMPFPIMEPRADTRYVFYYDEHLSEPLIWGADKSHAGSNSKKSVMSFQAKYLKSKGEPLYVWDTQEGRILS
jgi:hypothetical protein